ncbi:ribosomal protein S18 acetylase RimI-like enzyme [Ureibacillus xyleni]|uniref:Ribosomal protein S18 acetylase RimI-like enzyme n=1 Tax=Ureibacillus xyleni TaxID=614648 RepID=A0A285T3D0_9BACL|nr:GNAT family N-acetyltransferase [Ureibacillus xyleni]SOC15469.1 ribosomal protein S18 acetylase RimI-like enzyme [Ureibacillus xyleni]
MHIKTIDKCTLVDILSIWNEGFSNYFVPVHMDVNSFLKRLANEDIDASSSFVAEEDGQLQGILLNGFYEHNGEILAWNGGTAVHPNARRKGVGRMLLQKSLVEYKARGVKRASLEAIKENTGAILLYEEFGYKIKDELIYFKGHIDKQASIDVEFINPKLLPKLSIYNEDVPWQCRLQSNFSAQAAIFFDQSKNPIGYALFKQTGDETTNIIQLELTETVTQDEFLAMLASLTEGGSFRTVNTPSSSRAANHFINLRTEEILRQVWMEKEVGSG